MYLKTSSSTYVGFTVLWKSVKFFRMTKVVFYWDQPFLVRWFGWVFSCSIGEKLVSVGLVDQRFQPASNQVETVEKQLRAYTT